jgi:hypothetical protein
MNALTMGRAAISAILLATFALGADKTPPAYQHGTIKGWDKRTGIWGWVGANGETYPRDKTVYELKGTGLIYLIDYCGAFQAGKFELGQAVDYRTDEADKNNLRLYIRRDNGKEYKCKIEGKKVLKDAETDAPSSAAPPAKP